MTPKPTIAVLITCHNRKDKTIQCLTALYAQAGLGGFYTIEVFLVDDASNDGTGEAIKNQFPEVNIIQGNGNLFWNRGMHLAWKTASTVKDFDYYLWLNDDTFLYKNAIIMLLNGSQLLNKKSVICGSTVSLETNTISYGGFSKESKMLIPNGKLQEVFAINGNCVLIPKYVFKIIGILDRRFPHAIGDFEYGMRVRKRKLKSYIDLPTFSQNLILYYQKFILIQSQNADFVFLDTQILLKLLFETDQIKFGFQRKRKLEIL